VYEVRYILVAAWCKGPNEHEVKERVSKALEKLTEHTIKPPIVETKHIMFYTMLSPCHIKQESFSVDKYAKWIRDVLIESGFDKCVVVTGIEGERAFDFVHHFIPATTIFPEGNLSAVCGTISSPPEEKNVYYHGYWAVYPMFDKYIDPERSDGLNYNILILAGIFLLPLIPAIISITKS